MSVRVAVAALAALALPFGSLAAETKTVEGDVRADTSDSENWRAVDPENLIIFDTNKGRILIEIFPDVAPRHAEQFRSIVRSGDFDGTSFHRVIDGFMAQGGDVFALKGRESGLPDIPGEFTFRRDPAAMTLDALGDTETARDGYIDGFPIKTQAAWLSEMSKDGLVESYIPHCPGVVSTARTSDPDSANSQFFLMRGRADHLDRQYTAWGRILDGLDVVLAIETGEPPTNPDTLERAAMAADLPEGERPRVWVQRTDGPSFAAALEAGGAIDEPDVCALEPVPTIVEG